jgi:hypothetical protein
MGWFNKKNGSKPIGDVPIILAYGAPMYFYQEKQTFPWPDAPAHESRGALTNAWTGNQLPGYTNVIPGVAASTVSWLHSTAYMNTLINKQYNVGYNIMTESSMQSAILTKMIQDAWQNRIGYALNGQ